MLTHTVKITDQQSHITISQGARSHKKVRPATSPASKLMLKIRAHGPRRTPAAVVPTSPLAATFHPKSRFHSHEEQVMEEVKSEFSETRAAPVLQLDSTLQQVQAQV